MIEHVVHRNAEDDEKYAVPLGQDLAARPVGDPAVEVIAQERQEQRESIDQAVGRRIKSAPIQGENLRQKSINRIVREEQAGHEEQHLQEVPHLRWQEQAEEGRLLDFPFSFGLLEFRRLVQIASNPQRQENGNNAGHESDAPTILMPGWLCRRHRRSKRIPGRPAHSPWESRTE